MSDHEISEGDREAPQDISNPQVAEKCRVAAEIVNAALRFVLSRVVPGADVFELCVLGDAFIENEAKKVYQKKDKAKRKIEKGIAVPTSVSVDEVFANFSPAERSASRILKKADIVKVDLGAHIDGFVAAATYTVVCCSRNSVTFEGVAAASAAEAAAAAEAVLASSPAAAEVCRQQQLLREEGKEPVQTQEIQQGLSPMVVSAAYTATEAGIRKMQIGAKASEVSKVIEEVAKEYNVRLMQGVMSHQLKQHVIEGSRCFPLVTAVGEEKQEDFTFEANEAYALDVVCTTGEGRAREAEMKPTIFRRAVERKYILKSQLGRAFMSQIENNFPTLPFSLRQVSDERAAKVGVAEAMRHELLVSYPVMQERTPELTARFRVTVHLTPSGIKKVTGLPFIQERLLAAPHVQNEEIKALLATSLNPKKNKRRQKEETAKA